ncbi:MAG: hypothetical protein AB1665_02900 [Candidatus Thermoplasmatota archaeon]
MEVNIGIDGKPYAIPDIVCEFKNGKARRRYPREVNYQPVNGLVVYELSFWKSAYCH